MSGAPRALPEDAHPTFDDALRQAMAFHEKGRLTDAVAWYRRALTVRPGSAETYNNLAVAFLNQQRFDDAIRSFEAALSLRPSYAKAHVGLATLLQNRNRYSAAIDHYAAALETEPGLAPVRFNMAIALQTIGEAARAAECYRVALAAMPGEARALSQYLLCLNYLSDLTPEAVFAEHARFGSLFPPAAPAPYPAAPAPERRLRIGYLSVEFRQHLGGYFVSPILEAADREEFEIHCYSALPPDAYDDHTARFRTLCDGWHSVVDLSDAGLVERIRTDRIDILVDLAGHSGLNRLPALAARPAPVQVTWLGYPNTTGMAAIDYRLVDAITDPEGEADAYASERLVRLPRPFLCFKPPSDAPEVTPPPALGNGFVTFGSFNNQAKHTPDVLRLWAGILQAVPDSRLLLKDRALDCPDAVARLRGRFVAMGVAPERLEVAGWAAGRNDHLALYGRVDVALDPFPYNGTITTCDALWMGVPLVTLLGDRHAARVGASLLDAVDLPDLVAATEAEYVDKAVALARDLPRLAALRAGMRPRLLASPLCDAVGFTRNLEAAYRAMWRSWCATV